MGVREACARLTCITLRKRSSVAACLSRLPAARLRAPSNYEPYGLIGYGDHPHEEGTAIRAVTFWGTTVGDAQCLSLAGRLTRSLMLPIYWAREAEPKVVVGAERAHFFGHMHGYRMKARW